MSEPPTRARTEGPADSREWQPLADQIAASVKIFVDGVEALAQGGGDETVPLLLLEVSQILLAGAQLAARQALQAVHAALGAQALASPFGAAAALVLVAMAVATLWSEGVRGWFAPLRHGPRAV